MIDKDEYPQTAEIEHRCVHMLADLWNAPDPSKAPGCSTVGSSEACMLGGLAIKRRWQQRAARPASRRQAQHRHGHQRPGLLGEVRQLLRGRAALVPMEGDRFHLTGEEA
jgi:glutamate decarboxylase